MIDVNVRVGLRGRESERKSTSEIRSSSPAASAAMKGQSSHGKTNYVREIDIRNGNYNHVRRRFFHVPDETKKINK